MVLRVPVSFLPNSIEIKLIVECRSIFNNNYFFMIEIIRTARSIISATRQTGIFVPPYGFILEVLSLITQISMPTRVDTSAVWYRFKSQQVANEEALQ